MGYVTREVYDNLKHQKPCKSNAQKFDLGSGLGLGVSKANRDKPTDYYNSVVCFRVSTQLTVAPLCAELVIVLPPPTIAISSSNLAVIKAGTYKDAMCKGCQSRLGLRKALQPTSTLIPRTSLPYKTAPLVAIDLFSYQQVTRPASSVCRLSPICCTVVFPKRVPAESSVLYILGY